MSSTHTQTKRGVEHTTTNPKKHGHQPQKAKFQTSKKHGDAQYGAPSKGGGGGKYTWGSATDMNGSDCPPADKNDPNYVDDGDDAVVSRSPPKATLGDIIKAKA